MKTSSKTKPRNPAYPKKVRVNVTRKDIDLGIRCCATMCPIARAMNRVIKMIARVENDCVLYQSKRSVIKAKLPKKACEFYKAFDNYVGRDELKPFVFNVTLKKEPLPLPK